MSHESICSVCSRPTGFGDEERLEPPVNLARCPAPGGLECRAVAQAVAPLRRENEVLRSNSDHLSSENASLASQVESYTEELVKRIVQNHPRFSIKVRSKTWLGVVFKVLQFITRNDYSEFCTTVGSTVYVPDSFQSWPDQAKYRLLRHELVHVDQFNTRPFGPKLWWLNAWIVGFCYLLVLPAIWTLRAHWEREAYTQSILADHEMNRLTPEKQMEYIEHMGAVFGTSMYVWMWRREKAKAWTRQTIINVINGTITNQKYNVTERS